MTLYKRYRKISVLISATFLTVVSVLVSAQETTREVSAQRISRIAIVPLVGEELVLQRIGVMVFGNRGFVVKVPEWGLNDELFNVTKEALGNRYELTRINANADEFEKLNGGFPRFNWENVADSVKGISSRCACDALLFVTRSSRGDSISGTNQPLSGLAWFWSERMRHTVAYAVYHLWLIDASGMRSIQDATSTLPSDGPFHSSPLPSSAFGRLEWPFDEKKLVDRDREKILPKLKELIRASMPETLRRVGLIETKKTE